MDKMTKLRKGVWWSKSYSVDLFQYKATFKDKVYWIWAENFAQASIKAEDWNKGSHVTVV